MPRYPDSPAVGAGLLAAVAESLAMLRRRITDDDPKVALRAASELTKLLSVCARHGIAVDENRVVPTPEPVKAALAVPETEAAKPNVLPPPTALPGGRLSPRIGALPAQAGTPVPPSRDPLPGRRRTLTSFLDPPAKAKTVRNGDATTARTG